MLITFSGLDGAGKSTLIERLRKKLEGEDRRVAVYHMYRHVGLYACARFLLARVAGEESARAAGAAGEADAPGQRGDGIGARASGAARRAGSAVVWSKTLRQCAYPLDLLIFLLYRLYVERLRGRVLIMDRYFYDTLVDVAVGGGWRGARLLALVTPTPHVPVLLDLSPEEAFARKGDHTVDYLSRRREAYRKFFPDGGRGIVIDAGGDEDTTTRALERVVLERMGTR